MKKIGVLIVLLMLFSVLGFVIALESDAPSLPGGADGSGVDRVNQLQGNFSPVGDDGKLNLSKYKPFKSKAEERIEGINLWIKDNASWLSVVFGMVPEVSFYFAVALFVWLFGFMTLILNSSRVFYFRFLSMKGYKKTGIGNTTLYMGIVTFVLLFIALKINIMVAKIYWVHWEWGAGTWWGSLIRIVVIVVVLITLFKGLSWWGSFRQKKAEEDAKEQEGEDREVIHVISEGITEDD